MPCSPVLSATCKAQLPGGVQLQGVREHAAETWTGFNSHGCGFRSKGGDDGVLMQSVHTSEIMPKLNWPALGAVEPCGLDMEFFMALALGFQIAWSIPRLMSCRLTAENLPKPYTLEMQI